VVLQREDKRATDTRRRHATKGETGTSTSSASRHWGHVGFGHRPSTNSVSTSSPQGTDAAVSIDARHDRAASETNERLNQTGQFYYTIIAVSRCPKLVTRSQLHVLSQSIYSTVHILCVMQLPQPHPQSLGHRKRYSPEIVSDRLCASRRNEPQTTSLLPKP